MESDTDQKTLGARRECCGARVREPHKDGCWCSCTSLITCRGNERTCDQSPTGHHDPFVPDRAMSRSTCMAGPNRGSTTVRCSWCGIWGEKFWHEEYRQLEDRGPYATRLVQVQDKIEWNSPR